MDAVIVPVALLIKLANAATEHRVYFVFLQARESSLAFGFPPLPINVRPALPSPQDGPHYVEANR